MARKNVDHSISLQFGDRSSMISFILDGKEFMRFCDEACWWDDKKVEDINAVYDRLSQWLDLAESRDGFFAESRGSLLIDSSSMEARPSACSYVLVMLEKGSFWFKGEKIGDPKDVFGRFSWWLKRESSKEEGSLSFSGVKK